MGRLSVKTHVFSRSGQSVENTACMRYGVAAVVVLLLCIRLPYKAWFLGVCFLALFFVIYVVNASMRKRIFASICRTMTRYVDRCSRMACGFYCLHDHACTDVTCACLLRLIRRLHSAEFKKLKSELMEQAAGRVVEIGPGPGTNFLTLARSDRVSEWIGIEVSCLVYIRRLQVPTLFLTFSILRFVFGSSNSPMSTSSPCWRSLLQKRRSHFRCALCRTRRNR